MDRYERGVALAMAQSVELRRHVDQQRLARRVPGRTGDRVPGHRTFRADTPRPLPPQAAAVPPRRSLPAVPDEQRRRQPC
jgi:hypothetical protein